MDMLEKVGISMKKVTEDLVTQAVKLFAEPFDKLLNSVDAKCKFVSTAEIDPQTYSLPAAIETQLQAAIEDFKMAGKVRRLWARDASLWTGTDEGSWISAGSALPRTNSRIRKFSPVSPPTSRAPVSSKRYCSAWAVPVWLPRSSK